MGFMDKLSATLEKFLLPVAQKVGSQRHLVALRDGFIATLTASMAGAFAVLINCVFLQNDSLVGEQLNKIGFWANNVQPALDSWFMDIGWSVQLGTLKIIAILLVITISYSLAKSYDADPLAAAVVAFACYFALLPSSLGEGFTSLNSDGEVIEGVSDVFQLNFFGSNSMFATIITAFVATEIFIRLTKKGWVVKMPDSVPPAVSRSFAALIPGILTLVVFGIISVIFRDGIGKALPTWISDTIQAPLMSLGQSPATYIFLIFLAQFLWFFGLHGMNIVDGVLQPLYTPPLYENTNLVAQGLEPKYVLTRNFVDVYAMPGGSGGTMALLIALFIFSKREESKEIAKLAIAPACFQINEPVIFGLPIVLNVLYFIPFIITTPLLVFIAWFFTAVVPFADKISQQVPWTCPPVISAFLATNGDWKAAVLALLLLVLAILIWTPFVLVGNKMANSEEA